MRSVRRIFPAIALGLLTTLGLSWLLAAFMPVPMYPRRTARTWMGGDGSVWSANEVFPFGVHDIWWSRVSDDPVATPDEWLGALRARNKQLEADRRGTDEHMRARETPPGWGTLAHSRPGPADTDAIGSDTAFGWPLPCLWYSVRSTTQDTTGGITLVGEQLVGGISLDGTPSARMRSFHALPLLLIWPALLINTLFWSLFWLAALTLPRALRRRARLRLGHCTSCGYNLTGITNPTCPECGSACRLDRDSN